MRVVVTGAAGFLGRRVVAAAVQRGLTVDAWVRAGQESLPQDPALAKPVRVVGVNLDDPGAIQAALSGVDVVIHAAAAKSGDLQRQWAGTVVATDHLLSAMRSTGVGRLVGVSSLAVYDYWDIPTGALLDEHAGLDLQPQRRDAYARSKLAQDQRFRDFAGDADVTIVRPGIVYGPGACWQFCLGRAWGEGRWLRLGPDCDELPWTYVDNCADALVCAAVTDTARGGIVNLVDDERPGRRAFINALNRHQALRKSVIALPWSLHRFAAWLASDVMDRNITKGRVAIPGLLRSVDLAVRFKPLRYDNARARDLLDWTPRVSVAQALEQCAHADTAATSG